MGQVRTILEMIKFSHSIFALPFALCGAWLAAGGMPPLENLLLLLVAAVTARCAAMGFNRWVDRDLDQQNPRTKDRALPAGKLRHQSVMWFVIVNCVLFLIVAWLLAPICFWLSPIVLLILFFYSYTKRWTFASHFVLGFCLAMAPMGAWLAIREQFSADVIIPLVLGLSVLLWVAGFDLIYACGDVDFDRQAKLHSIPARFGIRFALWLSSVLHVGVLLCLFWLGMLANLGYFYWLGLVVVAALLTMQHLLVRPNDLSRLNLAFFTLNGWVGLGLFVATAMDFWVR